MACRQGRPRLSQTSMRWTGSHSTQPSWLCSGARWCKHWERTCRNQGEDCWIDVLSAMNARALTCRHNGRRYDGIIKLTRRLNSKFPTNRETQERTVGILASLFPSWLPSAFKVGAQGQLQLRSQAASLHSGNPACHPYTQLTSTSDMLGCSICALRRRSCFPSPCLSCPAD